MAPLPNTVTMASPPPAACGFCREFGGYYGTPLAAMMVLASINSREARFFASIGDACDFVSSSSVALEDHRFYGRLGEPVRFWWESLPDGSRTLSCVPLEPQATDAAQLLVAVNHLYGRDFVDPLVAREFLFAELGSRLSVVHDGAAIDEAFVRASQVLEGDAVLSTRWDVRAGWLKSVGHVALVELTFDPLDDDQMSRLVRTLGRHGYAELLAVDLAPMPSPYGKRLVWRLPATESGLRALRDQGLHVPHLLLPPEGVDWLMVVHPADEVALTVGTQAFIIDYAQNMLALLTAFEGFFLNDPRRPPPDADWPMLRHLKWMRDYVARH